nr:MAG TPA: hypothetical protein [Caudoviricetes sp.]
MEELPRLLNCKYNRFLSPIVTTWKSVELTTLDS